MASQTYHGSEALTYSFSDSLPVGTLVRIALRQRSTLGIVVRQVPKPAFDTKPIAAVAPLPPLPPEHLQLLRWMYAYYPAPLGTVVRQFVPPTEVFPQLDRAASTTPDKPAGVSLPPLTSEQSAALDTITGPGTFLLHGITGSGKSRVYVELAARSLAAGTSAIILTPEIGLTAQLTRTFEQAFGADHVYVLHSQMSAAERRNVWYRLLLRQQPCVVIGPRSALFSPLRAIGLIVLDEAHDKAYKNESAPHYHASRVAAKLASLHGATLVLGSATPSVEDVYLAQMKQRPIIAMNALAKASDASVTTTMVDMRDRTNFSRHPLLSTLLIEHIGEAMQRGEQTLLFLNRRGTANVVLCSQCGWQSLCSNCDLTLTYHGDTHELRCHVCGRTEPLPTACPQCGNAEILFKSVGTKAVVDAVQKLFPAARIQRFDTDAKKAERLERHLDHIAAGSVDVIVGTQMVGKGLDLPKLSVVGIINADSSLLIPDFTAAEQTYQLITQVAGRVGRGHRAGTVVVQTYGPDNPTLQAAVHRQWEAFYQTELAERKAFRYPPFTYLLKLRVLRATSKAAQKVAEDFAKKLGAAYPTAIIDGPAPSFHPRERGKYSWQLLVKSPHRGTLTDIISMLPSGWNYDIDPSNLL